MASSNLQEVRDELVDLFDRQLNILEDEVFGVVTESELVEYEDRKDGFKVRAASWEKRPLIGAEAVERKQRIIIAWCFVMRHNEFDREHPCDGELIEQADLCTETAKVMWCLRCAIEVRHTIGSTRVTIIYPGMRNSMDWEV